MAPVSLFVSSAPRDPGGWDPSGAELGADPPTDDALNLASPTSARRALPPTPRKQTTPTAMMGSFAPPPPPPNDPPPRKHRHSPRSNNTPSPVALRDSSRNAQEVFGPLDPSPTSTAASPMSTVDGTATTATMSFFSKNSISTMSIVEQRLRAARAIYESDSMVLDPPTENIAAAPYELPTPVSSAPSGSSSFSLPTVNRSEKESVAYEISKTQSSSTASISQPLSTSTPVSSATEVHVNHNDALEKPTTSDIENMQVSSETKTKSTRRFRPKTPERIRRIMTPERLRSADKNIVSNVPEKSHTSSSTPLRLRRSKTPDKRQNSEKELKGSKTPDRLSFRNSFTKTPERRRQKSTQSEQQSVATSTNTVEKKKSGGGFFKKMFGKGKKNKKTQRDTNTNDAPNSVVAEETVIVRKVEESPSIAEANEWQDVKVNTTPSMDEDLPKTEFSLSEDDHGDHISQDDVSTLTNPTWREDTKQDHTDIPKVTRVSHSDPMGQYWDQPKESTNTSDQVNSNTAFESDFTMSFPDPFLTYNLDREDSTSKLTAPPVPVVDKSRHLTIETNNFVPSSTTGSMANAPMNEATPPVRNLTKQTRVEYTQASPQDFFHSHNGVSDLNVTEPINRFGNDDDSRVPVDSARQAIPLPMTNYVNAVNDVAQVEEEKKEDDTDFDTSADDSSKSHTVVTAPWQLIAPPPPPPGSSPRRSKKKSKRSSGSPKSPQVKLDGNSEHTSKPFDEKSVAELESSDFEMSTDTETKNNNNVALIVDLDDYNVDDDDDDVVVEDSPQAAEAVPVATTQNESEDEPNGGATCMMLHDSDTGAGITEDDMKSITLIKKDDIARQRFKQFGANVALSKAKSKAMRLQTNVKSPKESNYTGYSSSESSTSPRRRSHDKKKTLFPISKAMRNDKRTLYSTSASTDGQSVASSVDSESQQKQAKKKPLSVTAAARMNARAVAYIHNLNGQPSPRQTWKTSSHNADKATLESPKYNAKTKSLTVAIGKLNNNGIKSRRSVVSPKPEEMQSYRKDTSPTVVSSFSGRFMNRQQRKNTTLTKQDVTSKTRQLATLRRSNRVAKESRLEFVKQQRMERDVGISRRAVKVGMIILRMRRDDDIVSGRSKRVVPVPQRRKPVAMRSNVSAEENEPKDPIQRAGRRLLAKAAIPIQAAARSYLAQKEAVDRMWALIELQSYFRRWRAEAAFLATRTATIESQRIVRGFVVRHKNTRQHAAATDIQRIVRGFICSSKIYHMVYQVIILQASVRRMLVRNKLYEVHGAATMIQAQYRGAKAREVAVERLQATWVLQAFARGVVERQRYFSSLTDIIICQSIARKLTAKRKYDTLQRTRKNAAATKIQASWRSFQGYTDYIFVLIDVLVIQKYVRRWQAMKKYKAIRREVAAVTLQSQWRRYTCQVKMLFDLVHIILVQTIIRRYLARKYTDEVRCIRSAENDAATKIQASWRGVWQYSIYRVNTAARKIQTAWRGAHQRSLYRNERAAIKIQATWRGMLQYMIYTADRSAVKIQAAWRGVYQYSLYRATRSATKIQAIWRGKHQHSLYRTTRSATKIQAVWRGIYQHSIYRTNRSAIKIQATWRGIYQYSIYRANRSATKIQAAWRGVYQYSLYRATRSATKIQAAWRGYWQYSLYRVIRSATKIQAAWRGIYQYSIYQATRSATRIQTFWRCYRQKHLYRNLRAAIKIQAAWRGYWQFSLYRINKSALKIQSAWRGFWAYSHFVIVQYETVRLQALVRRFLCQRDYSLKLGCCIMLQTCFRRTLAKARCEEIRRWKVASHAAAIAMQETNACERIQFWWRVVIDCRREKQAALTIERFFIMVKAEVEREIRRVEKKKMRRQKKKEHEDRLLEKVWLNTVDENQVQVFPPSTRSSPAMSVTADKPESPTMSLKSSSSVSSSRSKSSAKRGKHSDKANEKSTSSGIRHKASSPSMNLVMRHESYNHNSPSPTAAVPPPESPDSLLFSFSEDTSGLSTFTRSTVGSNNKAILSPSKSMDADNRSPVPASNAYIRGSRGAKVSKIVDKRRAAAKTAPNRVSETNHFFADDLESPSSQETFQHSRLGLSQSAYTMSYKSPASQSVSSRYRQKSKSTTSKDSRGSNSVNLFGSSEKQRSSDKASSPNQDHRPIKESPRHGSISVMSAYSSYSNSRKLLRVEDEDDDQFLGDDFGLI